MGKDNSPQAVLEALKKEGVNTLEEFASWCSDRASQTDKDGNPIVPNSILSPGYFVDPHRHDNN